MAEINALSVLGLYQAWLNFLDQTARYTQKYYLHKHMKENQGQNQKAKKALHDYYDGDERSREEAMANLRYAMDIGRNAMRRDIAEIRQAQVMCGCLAFSDREEYTERIIDGFTLHENNSRLRQEWYRRHVKTKLRQIREGKTVEPESLNDLEGKFQKYMEKRAERKAKAS